MKDSVETKSKTIKLDTTSNFFISEGITFLISTAWHYGYIYLFGINFGFLLSYFVCIFVANSFAELFYKIRYFQRDVNAVVGTGYLVIWAMILPVIHWLGVLGLQSYGYAAEGMPFWEVLINWFKEVI